MTEPRTSRALNDIDRRTDTSVVCYSPVRERYIMIADRSEQEKTMASNKTLVPEAKEALERFKMEAASEVGVNLKQGYNGDLTSKQAGSVGGQMVKKMIESYENSLKTK